MEDKSVNSDSTEVSENISSKDQDFETSFMQAVERYNQSIANTDLLTEAIDCCRELVKTFPSSAEPYFLLALIAYRCGDEGQAITMCETAHKIAPNTREYAEALSVILIGVGQFADGLYYAKIATTLESHPRIGDMMPERLKDLEIAFETASPSGHFAEASRLFNIASYARVIKECSAEIRLNPRNFEAYLLFARTLMIVGSYEQATNALHAAIQIDPAAALPRAMLARALTRVGEFDEARVLGETALAMSEKQPDAETYALAMDALLSCPDYPLERAHKISIAFQQAYEKENKPEEPPKLDVDATRPAHIGLISNAFFNNDFSNLFLPWFAAKDYKSATFFGYQQSVLNDSVTTQAKSFCDHWREIYDTDPFTFSITARTDVLDVFVNLSSVDWISRMDFMAQRPAPARVGVFGLPEPSFELGATHVLCDDVLANASDDILMPGQKKLVFNGSLFARSAFVALKNDFETPAIRNGFVTFGGISDLSKLTPDCAAIWSKVLLAVPKSKLLICGRDHTQDGVRNRILQYFSRHGTVDRLMFVEDEASTEPAIESIEAKIPNTHWAEIDVLLDTAPKNCRTESIEALWTGAPVISLSSNRRAGLIGSSILTAARRVNWIANSSEEFVNIARDLVSDFEKLAHERKRLQEKISSSALFDPEAMAMEIRRTLSELALKARSNDP